ncbi:unnamed protein product [Diplocarpon coronariae]|uniref:Uncharacterized protein n=1 Tax=Diplocarpon coronariae TaxID=2795749 RepID=A0A218YU77_9HELO|nr:hypothetical protein B2J93_9075 [Marssonina coronariae]
MLLPHQERCYLTRIMLIGVIFSVPNTYEIFAILLGNLRASHATEASSAGRLDRECLPVPI